jgi:hypothetical protein
MTAGVVFLVSYAWMFGLDPPCHAGSLAYQALAKVVQLLSNFLGNFMGTLRKQNNEKSLFCQGIVRL